MADQTSTALSVSSSVWRLASVAPADDSSADLTVESTSVGQENRWDALAGAVVVEEGSWAVSADRERGADIAVGSAGGGGAVGLDEVACVGDWTYYWGGGCRGVDGVVGAGLAVGVVGRAGDAGRICRPEDRWTGTCAYTARNNQIIFAGRTGRSISAGSADRHAGEATAAGEVVAGEATGAGGEGGAGGALDGTGHAGGRVAGYRDLVAGAETLMRLFVLLGETGEATVAVDVVGEDDEDGAGSATRRTGCAGSGLSLVAGRAAGQADGGGSSVVVLALPAVGDLGGTGHDGGLQTAERVGLLLAVLFPLEVVFRVGRSTVEVETLGWQVKMSVLFFKRTGKIGVTGLC